MSAPDARAERFFRVAIAVYGFVLILAVYFGTMDPSGDIKALLTRWVGFLLCGGWLIVARWTGTPLRRPRVFPEMLAGLLLFYAVATMRSEYRMFSILEVTRLASLAAIYFTVSQVYHTPSQVARLFWTLCAAMALSSTYGFMQAAGFDPLPWAGRETDVYTGLPATFGNPNFAAHTLILTIIMALYLGWQGFVTRRTSDGSLEPRRVSHLWLLAFWLVGYYGFHLNATDQRAGLVALAAAAVLVVIAYVMGRRFRNPVAGMVATMVALGLVAVIGLVAVMGWSHARTGRYFPLDTSLLLRYQSYVSASEMVLDAPLLGHGPGVYKYTYPAYWTQFEQEWFAQEFRKNDRVHNDLLETAIDAGLPAAGFYLAILVLGMCHGLLLAFGRDPARRRLGYALAAAFCAFLVDGLFGFNFRVPVSAAILFLLMGVLDGVVSPARHAPARRTGFAAAFRWAVLVALLGGAVLESSSYAAKLNLRESVRWGRNPRVADRILAQAQDLAPWEPAIARERGRLAMFSGATDAAKAHYLHALSLDPHNIPTHLPMAHLNLQRAIQLFEQTPGKVAESMKALDAATEHARQVLAICPMHPVAQDFLGRITATRATVLGSIDAPEAKHASEEEWRRAEEQLLRAVELGAENQAELHELVARVRMALGDTEGVEEAYVRAAQTDLTRTATWPLFLAFAEKNGRYDRLRKALEDQIARLEEADDTSSSVLVDTQLFLASALEAGYGDLDGASRVYRAAAMVQPDRAAIWSNYAAFAQRHQLQGALATSIVQVCDALTARGDNLLPQVAAVDAVLRRSWEALPNASFVLLGALRTQPSAGGIPQDLAFGWALNLLVNAATNAPDPSAICSAFLNLALAQAHLGRLEAADRLFARADTCLEGEARGPLAVQWADALVRMGRTAEAITFLERESGALPDDLELRWALARCLTQDGRLDCARQVYERLLAEDGLDPRGRAMMEKELAGF